jgi:hypothetical protein
MNLPVRAPFRFLVAVGLLAALAGCDDAAVEKQIRERIGSIREAILAERAEGIVEFSTADWTFDAPDGKLYGRTAYLERTKKLFANIEIESLDTHVDRIERHDSRLEVWLTQTMVRVETDTSGTRSRWRVSYQEHQDWLETDKRGWLMTRVRVFQPKRESLPLR